MSNQPKLCILFEATGPYNAIGKIAMAQAEAALAAGWQVSVVANRLHESLQGRVKWLKLYVPPRGFAIQWLTARHFIRKAAGNLNRFNVIHGHQPQIADLCHIFQCHFLTRAAHERKCLIDSHGPRRFLEIIQKRAVLVAEDRHYGRWNPKTHMLFNSALTRDTFARFYQLPASQEILTYPSPPWNPVTSKERIEARSVFGLPSKGIVIGFLGGCHERKGYLRVVEALRGQTDITLCFGGLHSEGFKAPQLDGHFVNVGLVRQTSQFYAACDVLVLPSYFEPYGYVASEAAASGIPTLATEGVGCLPHLIEHNAGALWNVMEPLGPLVRKLVAEKEEYWQGCLHYTTAYSTLSHNSRLLDLYEQVASKWNVLPEAHWR